MKWEITEAIRWPQYLVEGEFPSRGTHAVEDNRKLEALLADGWEPFAVEPTVPVGGNILWLKRAT